MKAIASLLTALFLLASLTLPEILRWLWREYLKSDRAERICDSDTYILV